jgi:type IV pilus assembly protein PilY1
MIASHHAPLRRFAGRTSLGFAGALALLGSSTAAFAQAEAQKPAPNVLLLVDSSGSMEFTTSGSEPVCTPGNPSSQKSRWIELVEALTGKITNYSCWTQPRSELNFRNEFRLGGIDPYDYRYVNPYHRALSGTCLYGPGVVDPAAPYAWPTVPVSTHPLSGGVVQAGSCTFNQATDGVLDVYKEMVRFGLMTFDARIGIGTGVTALNAADYSSGFDGNWSYHYPNNEPVTGHPANCNPLDPVYQEVGARNAAAPPWEGRMIAFGPPNDPPNSPRNDWIQKVLLSTRPYGATPIAGQLDDARKFLWSDVSNDPLNAGQQFGPVNDPNWRADSCRKTILILLTDGEPNLDLRPFCEMSGTPNGKCPYDQPDAIVRALYEVTGDDHNIAPPKHMSVETYVVGFAIGSVTRVGDTTPTACSALNTLTDCTAAKIAANPSLTTCCTLNKIANAGGKEADGITPRNARFASNQAELTAIFTDILDDVIQIATRTTPVFSSPGGDAVSKGFKFFSAFDPRPDPTKPQLWEGVLERSRYLCTDGVPGTTPLNANEGDDFAANLNSGLGPARHFYSVIGADNARSMRPYFTETDDGIGAGTGTQVRATSPAGLANEITAAAMGVTPAEHTTILEHLLGINTTGPSRCGKGDCSRLGGIYHSVPVAVPGRPSDLLRDESYERFVKRMFEIKRPSVLYTSTVDGFLHAFNVAPFPDSDGAEGRRIKTKQNNELWAFIPPAVVPVLDSQYPANPVVLLDGLPIIKDVVATVAGTEDDREVTSYERGQVQATSGSGEWRTVLVQGFGATSEVKGGYFAIDITEPDRGDTAGDARPIFRWQLTQSSSGTPLFGRGGTPLITTVFLDSDSSGPPREVAVAVLPGGDIDVGVTPGPGPVEIDDDLVMDTDPPDFKTERPVRAYPAGTENARSLTIVRLDTGEVIRSFRPNLGPYTAEKVALTNIPAPITGQPKAYPEITGAVADRIYVGDRDGRMWRVDVSSQDPEKWSMTVFYDAFEDGTTAAVGQPVILPPVLSVDEIGDVTVAFATGTQELDSALNRVVSLTETLVADDDDKKFVTHVNWIHKLGDPDDPLDPARGDRVTGPMVLFNSALYYAVSHAPQTTGNACDVGSSKVYGVHYIQSKDFETALANGVAPVPTTGPAPAPGSSDIEIVRQAGLVFGVSLEAEPSCFDVEGEVSGNDSFGYGTVTMAKKVNPGKYYLTYGASGNSGDARGVLEVKQQLSSPNLAVTFDSWAVVYE